MAVVEDGVGMGGGPPFLVFVKKKKLNKTEKLDPLQPRPTSSLSGSRLTGVWGSKVMAGDVGGCYGHWRGYWRVQAEYIGIARGR